VARGGSCDPESENADPGHPRSCWVRFLGCGPPAGHTTDRKRNGYRERRQREADWKIVRVIGFERALAMLPPHEQAALILAYRDRATRHEIARILAYCDRSAYTLVGTALRHLAQTLDRLDLL